MENTGKVLFEDSSAQWFIALGKNWLGPLTAADVYAKILSQEISWAHFIWRKSQKEWQRVCDTPPFKAAVPSAPSAKLKEEVVTRSREVKAAKKAPPPPPSPAKAEPKIWYLYVNETQMGPFSQTEIEQELSTGRATSRSYVWRDGMAGWERIEKIAALAGKVKAASVIVPAGQRKKAEKSDLRGTPRKPMVARILLANESEVGVAICRDISVGGMQVLTDKAAGPVGTVIKLNVSPVVEKGKRPDFKSFVAEGTVVRILEDGRGFSFRFTNLTDGARRSIEAYLKT